MTSTDSPVRREIASAISRLDDNLHRARLQQGADPNWKSGNGEPITEMIAGYQRERDNLVADAKRYGIVT